MVVLLLETVKSFDHNDDISIIHYLLIDLLFTGLQPVIEVLSQLFIRKFHLMVDFQNFSELLADLIKGIVKVTVYELSDEISQYNVFLSFFAVLIVVVYEL